MISTSDPTGKMRRQCLMWRGVSVAICTACVLLALALVTLSSLSPILHHSAILRCSLLASMVIATFFCGILMVTGNLDSVVRAPDASSESEDAPLDQAVLDYIFQPVLTRTGLHDTQPVPLLDELPLLPEFHDVLTHCVSRLRAIYETNQLMISSGLFHTCVGTIDPALEEMAAVTAREVVRAVAISQLQGEGPAGAAHDVQVRRLDELRTSISNEALNLASDISYLDRGRDWRSRMQTVEGGDEVDILGSTIEVRDLVPPFPSGSSGRPRIDDDAAVIHNER